MWFPFWWGEDVCRFENCLSEGDRGAHRTLCPPWAGEAGNQHRAVHPLTHQKSLQTWHTVSIHLPPRRGLHPGTMLAGKALAECKRPSATGEKRFSVIGTGSRDPSQSLLQGCTAAFLWFCGKKRRKYHWHTWVGSAMPQLGYASTNYTNARKHPVSNRETQHEITAFQWASFFSSPSFFFFLGSLAFISHEDRCYYSFHFSLSGLDMNFPSK